MQKAKARITPVSYTHLHLAGVTGNLEKSFAMRDLYKFGVFLQKNSFWIGGHHGTFVVQIVVFAVGAHHAQDGGALGHRCV